MLAFFRSFFQLEPQPLFRLFQIVRITSTLDILYMVIESRQCVDMGDGLKWWYNGYVIGIIQGVPTRKKSVSSFYSEDSLESIPGLE